MYEKRNDHDITSDLVNPLKLLTPAQFAALGGNAVAYMRPIRGDALSEIVKEAEFEAEEDYQLLMSADGTPLMVSDAEDAVMEWLGERNIGLATLH